MKCCQVEGNSPGSCMPQHSNKVLKQNFMFVLLVNGYLISIHQFGYEVLPLSKTSLFVEERSVRITFFKIADPRSETSNRSFQGGKEQAVLFQFTSQPIFIT